MQLHTFTVRRYDFWLVAVTCTVIAFFALVAYNLVPVDDQQARIGEIHYLEDPSDSLNLQTLPPPNSSRWQAIANPVNLGMNNVPYWFTFTLPVIDQSVGKYLLEINYPLLDDVQVSFYAGDGLKPLEQQHLGDGMAFAKRIVSHESLLFTVPESKQPMRVVIRVLTTGSIKLPVRLWMGKEFIEYTSRHNLVMGVFFGFLFAMGISNLFFFLTTRNRTFLVYSGYVFSLALTLASMHGLGYAHLWPEQVWFQGRAVAIFANAAIMFAVIFSNWLLDVEQYNKRLAGGLNAISAMFFINILVSLLLPYAYLIKIFLVLLSIVVVVTLSIGVWLSLRGVIIARYYSFAWSFLLVSGLAAALDNLNLVTIPIPSNYLVMLGAAVETLILALVLAISYSHNREDMFAAQEKALAQERAALEAKEELIAVQQQLQDDLEYKVQERTLELEIALRELSEANQELENLNTIDPLTGIRNRRYFDKRLLAEGRRSRREQTPLSLAMVDIDHFKSINDTYGHAGGDACLRKVTELMQEVLKRPTDDLCRYGGEEFAIILPNTELEGARQVVDSLRVKIAETPVLLDGNEIKLTISVGVSTTVIGYDAQEMALLRAADELLYAAKQAGRNCVKAAELAGQ